MKEKNKILHPETRPRLNVDITEKQYIELEKLIPWGLKNSLFGAIVDDIIEVLSDEKYRDRYIAIIIGKKMKALEYSKTIKYMMEEVKKEGEQ